MEIATLAGIPAYSQTASELMQKGIYTTETAGNLDGAISVFRQIVNSGSSSRDLAAQARYRLAQSLLRKADIGSAPKDRPGGQGNRKLISASRQQSASGPSPTSMARLALGFLTVALMASAQIAEHPTAEPPTFEVATVRRSPPPEGDNININLGTVRNGKVTFANASLSDCLKFAYGIVSDDQIGGPDWIKSKAVRFDIVAQAPADTPRDQLTLMLQPLLRDRLKLEMHHEPRTMSFLALVVGKTGPTLTASTKENDTSRPNAAFGGRIASNRMSMQLLATLISRFERRTVVDMTGLAGNFEVHLEWTLDSPSTTVSPDAPRGPSIFTAVQEQLGLKLESRKEPLDVVVVDHAEQVPTEN